MKLRDHWLVPSSPFDSYRAYLDAVRGGAVPGSLSPDVVVDQIQRSGLRGRGGAGFPSGVKWRALKTHACATRYVVCNAAEGEPGTFKDRHLLRYNPYAPIEGILIAAFTIGAEAVYIAIKKSFVKEIQRLREALEEMKAVVGETRVTLVLGPEEYLFGEEKALLSVIEGEWSCPDFVDTEHGLR